MIFLYIKTHNITGLKYFGKTERDPYSYRGSGKYWRRHIKKYGYDVSTEIVFESSDLEEIKEKGLYYSELWNIVESNEWANLITESGSGGDTSKYINYEKVSLANKNADLKGCKNPMWGKKHSEESINKMKSSKIGKTHSEEHKKKAALARTGKTRGSYKKNLNRSPRVTTEETRLKLRLAWKKRKLVGVSDETRKKMSESKKCKTPK